MDTTVKALKNLYVVLGGDADDVAEISRIPDMIEAFVTVLPAAIAAVLPAVTAEDNGSVLKVANGKWVVGTDATGT